MRLVLPPNLSLGWASPAWSKDGIELMFEHVSHEPRPDIRQQMLRLTSEYDDPDRAAADMAEKLRATSPDAWVSRFGWRRG